jgi:hypothetical protein
VAARAGLAGLFVSLATDFDRDLVFQDSEVDPAAASPQRAM